MIYEYKAYNFQVIYVFNNVIFLGASFSVISLKKNTYLSTANVCRIFCCSLCSLSYTCNQYNEYGNWWNIFPAQHPKDIWPTSSHVFYVIPHSIDKILNIVVNRTYAGKVWVGIWGATPPKTRWHRIFCEMKIVKGVLGSTMDD